MSKVSLSTIASLENQASAVAILNANSETIETAFDNTLSRDGTTPNTMQTSLDMNSNRILNLPIAVHPTDPVRLAEIGNTASEASAAAASATAAAASATTASASATSASSSATAAANSAIGAAASAVLAAGAAAVNISGMTNHGVMIATGASTGTSLGSMTDGQLLVGVSGANPAIVTSSGDVTINNSGVTAIGSNKVTNAMLAGSIDLTTKVTGSLPIANGGTAGTTAATARTSLGLAIGTDVQAFDAQLFSNIPQNSKSAAYTTVLTDGNKHIYHPSADTTARTWTIDSNANVAYPIGTAITFINDTSAGTLTISITADTLVLAGSGATGSRTLLANGIATAIKVTSTRWIISGTNLS